MKKAVFGMGIALINHWPIISEKFNPDFAIDNNSKKWGQIDAYTGLKCKALNEINHDEDYEVLITVGDSYAIQTISNQLSTLNIKYEILTEQLDKWYKDLPMPKRLESMQKDEKKIVLFNTPEHDNVGDHLITLSELKFLEKNFKDYKIYEVTDIEFLKFHSKIKDKIGKQDILLITGGGYAGSLWLYNGENNIRKIINEYPDNRIIMLPQTVYFEENERGNIEYIKSKKIYSSHKNLILCARERASFDVFVTLKGTTDGVYLIPDMALFYRVVSDIEKNSRLAVVCLRKDKESILDLTKRKEIKKIIEKKRYNIKTITMHSGVFDGVDGRNKQVEMKLEELAGAQIVITDTLHCMVSSALVGTTCFAFNNLSGKVKNVYKWIKDLNYVHFCDSIVDIEKEIVDIEKNNSINKYEFNNLDKYEQKLISIIKGE